MHGWVRCENDLQREVNFFRKNSARPEDRRRAHHRYTRGEGAGCVHNLGSKALRMLLSRTFLGHLGHFLAPLPSLPPSCMALFTLSGKPSPSVVFAKV